MTAPGADNPPGVFTVVENILKLPADLTHTAASVLFVFSDWLSLSLSLRFLLSF